MLSVGIGRTVKKWLKVDKFESRIKIMLMYRSFFKPLIGITLSILGLAVCGLPMLIIAIAIKMDSPGPVLFRQERLGKGMRSSGFASLEQCVITLLKREVWQLRLVIAELLGSVLSFGGQVLMNCHRCSTSLLDRWR